MDIRKKEIILNAISKNEYRNITDLASELEMPRTTLIYYINLLVEEKLVKKSRGNVIGAYQESVESKANDKINVNKRAKEAIAKKAASFVEDKDIIFIDGGSTNTFMLKYLADKDIIIYTNNILLVERVPATGFKPQLFVVPGELYKSTSTIVGALAISFISRVFVDKAFIGANSVSGEKFYTTNQQEAVIKNQLSLGAKKTFVLYDKTKLNAEGSKYEFATVNKNIKGVTD